MMPLQRYLLSPKYIKRGLCLWYKINEGVGQVVNDYSGQGNHGVLGDTGEVETTDPLWITSGLSFDGADYIKTGLKQVGNTRLFADNTQQFTIFVAGKNTSGAGDFIGRSATKAGTRMLSLYHNAGNLVVKVRGTTNNIIASDTNPHVYVIRWDGVVASYWSVMTGWKALTVGEEAEEVNEEIMLGAARVGLPQSIMTGELYYAMIHDVGLSNLEVIRQLKHINLEVARRGVILL